MNAQDIYGIDWKLSVSATAGSPTSGSSTELPLIPPNGLGLDNMVVGRINIGQLAAALDIIQNRGNSRVLANPSTLTLDNHLATVSMGTEVPIREITSDPKTGLVLATWRSQSVPISLSVTPHLTADGQINMQVEPSVEAITGYVGPADDQRPIIASRKASADITIGDGEVAVIGGLIQDQETRNVSRVPLLGQIPILGVLFSKTTVNHSKSNLMIFITPHVVSAEAEQPGVSEKYSVD